MRRTEAEEKDEAYRVRGMTRVALRGGARRLSVRQAAIGAGTFGRGGSGRRRACPAASAHFWFPGKFTPLLLFASDDRSIDAAATFFTHPDPFPRTGPERQGLSCVAFTVPPSRHSDPRATQTIVHCALFDSLDKHRKLRFYLCASNLRI